MTKKMYTLKKSEKILSEAYKTYKRKKNQLLQEHKNYLQEKLTSLQNSLWEKKREQASNTAKELEVFIKNTLPKSAFHRTIDFVLGIAVALFIALIIRQMWFELYTIPSGSMRPTLKEKDDLMVTKTPFGINTPWRTGHFLFNPDAVVRGSIFIFTAQDLDIDNPDTMYFYIIPGKKQLIKRLIGKPGDTLYFYGGQIYGIDNHGDKITQFETDSWFTDIEHIPFIHLDGKVKTPQAPIKGVFPTTTIYQMNEPVAKLSLTPSGTVEGKMLGKGKDLEHYYDLWGFKNYAVARILTKEELAKLTTSKDTGSKYYLQLIHHPTFENAELARDSYHRLRPTLNTTSSFIPLDQDLLEKIFSHIVTSRFQVKDGYIFRQDIDSQAYIKAGLIPKINVPDGIYEFENGKAFEIHWGGIRTEVALNHPLYNNDPKKIQLFFNMGYEFNNLFTPHTKDLIYLPARFSYFRNGDLYLMGFKFLNNQDSKLQAFVTKESLNPLPFIDSGSPVKADGSLDVDLIKKQGITIPDRMYLALGDNHAMSADSRDFGFVPEQNLRGKASFIFFPPSNRWGLLPQPIYPFFVLPRVIVWIVAFIIFIATYLILRKKRNTPLKF